jgi:cell division protein FtsI (penicillin-binding protein 3)
VREGRPNPVRSGIIFPVFVAGVAVLVGHLYTIQIRDHAWYVERGRRQSQTSTKIPAIRGSILDRNNVALALSLKTPTVFADPGIIAVPGRIRRWLPDTLGISRQTFKTFLREQPDELRREIQRRVNNPTLKGVAALTKQLAIHTKTPENVLLGRLKAAVYRRINDAVDQAAPVLGIDPAELRKTFCRSTRFVWLQRPATKKMAEQVAALKIRGIVVKHEYTRQTIGALSIGQWLGFMGDEGSGLEGLERMFEADLRGTPGLARLRRDGRGKRIADSADPTIVPRHGCHIRLTVDSRIQAVVNEEISQVFGTFTPVAVSVIVMEPDTGRVLALDSEPGLDVSKLGDLSRRELERRMRNHPVQSVYEYGSTFKPFIVAAALDLKLVTPETKINCENGVWRFRGRTLHDSHPNGILTVSGVTEQSSNIGAAKLGLKLGDRRLRQFVTAYYFGRRLGVRMPSEGVGKVTPESRWSYYTTTSVPMGQEISGTPLQLINAFCSLINGGRLMQPYVVESVEDPNTGEVTRRSPAVLGRVIREETSAQMRDILRQVVLRGTAKKLKSCKYPIGGKTGTAQKSARGGYSREKYVGSFIGFAPIDRPRICVLVMVDEPDKSKGYYGGTVAAPAVGRIIDRALAILESTPERNGQGSVLAAR